MNHNPSLLAKPKPLVDDNFIFNLDKLTKQLGLSVKTLKMFSLYFYQLNKSSSDLANYSF